MRTLLNSKLENFMLFINVRPCSIFFGNGDSVRFECLLKKRIISLPPLLFILSYGLICLPLIKILILLHFYYTKYYIIYSKLGVSIKKFYLMLLYYNLINISFKLI